MEQYGEVFEVMKDRAKIKVRRHSSCKSCGYCGLSSKDNLDVLLEVLNPIGAKVGEVVRISVETKKVLLASLLLYIVPVIALVTAMYITQQVAINMGYKDIFEVIGIVAGLGAMAVVFIILKLLDRRFSESQEFKPVILEIIPKGKYEDFLEE